MKITETFDKKELEDEYEEFYMDIKNSEFYGKGHEGMIDKCERCLKTGKKFPVSFLFH